MTKNPHQFLGGRSVPKVEPQDDSFSSDEETFQVFFCEILET
jgi:hypothetical protein